jgi:tetratricopeptide (TPR) repeat protein
MSFWRKEVIGFALSHETRRQIQEQRAWIERDPSNPKPYYHLAEFYRMEGRQEEALALLHEAVRLDESFAAAHVSLAEIYAVREDYCSAWRHARRAQQNGNTRAAEMLERYGAPE